MGPSTWNHNSRHNPIEGNGIKKKMDTYIAHLREELMILKKTHITCGKQIWKYAKYSSTHYLFSLIHVIYTHGNKNYIEIHIGLKHLIIW